MGRKSTDQNLKRLYMRSYFNGRGRFAQWADRAFFAVLVCSAVYLISRSFHVQNGGARVAGAAAGVGAFIASCIAAALQIDSHAAEKRSKTGIELARRRLLLEDDATIEGIIQKLNNEQDQKVYALIRKASAVDEDDICRAVRELNRMVDPEKYLALILPNDPPLKVREFAERIKNPKIEFVSFADVAPLIERFRADDEEISEELLLQAKKRPPTLRRPSAETLLNSAGKYRILGMTLLGASFVMRFSLYTRTLGMLCLAASLALDAGRHAKRMRTLDV